MIKIIVPEKSRVSSAENNDFVEMAEKEGEDEIEN